LTAIQNLQKTIGISFHDINLLQQAFIHSSYINENPGYSLPDNERLEFLGDALLSFIVAENLYQAFPYLSEGQLTEIRISLVRQETLAQLAAVLTIGNYLCLGKGEESTGGRQRLTNLADAFEALIGAVFLDQGLPAAREFVLAQLDSHIRKIKAGKMGKNYKALLQEFTQMRYKQLPTYQVLEETGPAHAKNFTVEVKLESTSLGKGSGKSKRAAEMEAARIAWERLVV